jgi:site-specific DNA-methyltransferase (adenine-specific)
MIHNSDCRPVLPTLPSDSVDFVLTDPPYLVNYTGRWDSGRRPVAGDSDPSWVFPVFAELFRVMRPNTLALTTYGWTQADVFVGTFKEIGFRLVSHLVFVKNVWGLGRFTRGQHEAAYLLAKGEPAMPDKPISDVVEWTREEYAFHPNQKPVGALGRVLSARTEARPGAGPVHGERLNAPGRQGPWTLRHRHRDRGRILPESQGTAGTRGPLRRLFRLNRGGDGREIVNRLGEGHARKRSA